MPAADALPDPMIVLEALEAFRRSKAMFAGVKLGVFDALAAGPDTAANVAARLACEPAALARLLAALVSMRLLRHEGDGFALVPAAATYLVSGSPARMTGYIHFANDISWKLWGSLEDCVRTGPAVTVPARQVSPT